MSRIVDNAVAELDTAMRTLRKSVRGVPANAGSFRATHKKLTQDAALLLVNLDAARPRFGGK